MKTRKRATAFGTGTVSTLFCVLCLLCVSNTLTLTYLTPRRDAISRVVSGGIPAVFLAGAQAKPCSAASISSTNLIELIPDMDFRAPATNATIPRDLSARIEALACSLESGSSNNNRDNAKSAYLSGSWRLLYSNGPEITSLAGGLPLGFTLGATYQPLDTASGRFENRGNVLNKFFNVAKLQTNVIGDVSVADVGTLNAVGVQNDRGNRVNVDFRCITFQLDELLGRVIGPPPLRKTLIPKLDPNVAQPANDVTYLDETVRIIRGGDGALFVFKREDSGVPMLTFAEREKLFSQGKSGVVVGGKKEVYEGQPELNFLFKENNP